jgi:hypothetical protein
VIYDFVITSGIYLSQPPHELDLHNNYDFLGLDYSIERRSLTLCWQRGTGKWVPEKAPHSLTLIFSEVSHFRFLPRDAEMPFTEDDCVSTFGYWTNEEWANGVVMLADNQQPDPNWMTAIEFQSGAIIIVRASVATANIVASQP